MSIEAINSLSIYEAYYQINTNKVDKKSMTNEISQKDEEDDTKVEEDKYQRPWAHLMHQLGIALNDDPKDDIREIKQELHSLYSNVSDDKELKSDVDDLESYVTNLYQNYIDGTAASGASSSLVNQLEYISTLSRSDINPK